jgi:hypothetical protein
MDQTVAAHRRSLRETDPDIAGAIRDEIGRQANGLELIASENFVSNAVLEAAGSVFTNKYAEGYPGRRYYGGCEFTDIVERLAIDRARTLFGADHANVQPHSGAQANMAVYFTLLKPGDTVLGMNLSHGGHLTHGHPLNFSGKLYTIVPYGVRQDDERLDYDDHLAPDGRVMEILSEHTCQGWLEGYLLTGRHGFFSCYEAFIHIIDSMFNQHAKWLKVTSMEIPWRRPIAACRSPSTRSNNA